MRAIAGHQRKTADRRARLKLRQMTPPASRLMASGEFPMKPVRVHGGRRGKPGERRRSFARAVRPSKASGGKMRAIALAIALMPADNGLTGRSPLKIGIDIAPMIPRLLEAMPRWERP